MKPGLAFGVLIVTGCFAPALAQQGAAGNGPSVAFAPVSGAPIPLHSASGRFSSLNPPNKTGCRYRQITGRVVSPRLIMVRKMDCGEPGHDNVLVNVQLSDPADAQHMITGRQVAIAADFKSAKEYRDILFDAEFLIAEHAKFVAGDRGSRAGPPAEPFTSYMICQAPELDALAGRLGKELCVQSTIVATLASSGAALEAAARSPSAALAADTAQIDPSAISCHSDPEISDRHLPAIACARNSYWDWYKGKRRDPLSPTPAPP
jgi:hypothetical protein